MYMYMYMRCRSGSGGTCIYVYVYVYAVPFWKRTGVFHESLGHECLKSSLAFRKPATAVASRRPGRADGLMVGLDGHASLSQRRPSSVARWAGLPTSPPEAGRQSLSARRALGLRHKPVGRRLMALCNPGNQYIPLIAGIRFTRSVTRMYRLCFSALRVSHRVLTGTRPRSATVSP